MARVPQRAPEVLSFWRAIEALGPPRLPERGAEEHVLDLGPDDVAPWDDADQPSGHFVVYGGLFSSARLEQHLADVFGPDLSYRDVAPSGDTALFAFTLDSSGRLVPGSAALSACAWAVGRTEAPGPNKPNWLDGLESDEQGFALVLDRLASGEAPGQVAGGPAVEAARTFARSQSLVGELQVRALHRFADNLADALGVAGSLRPSGVRVLRHDRPATRGRAPLNSPATPDLRLVARALRSDDIGSALADYLTDSHQIDTGRRVDVRDAASQLLTAVEPKQLSAGRWPSDAGAPLLFGQQLAASQIRRELHRSGGLFTLHAPPDTGRAAVLREVIADVVVERARHLAALSSPEDAFTEIAGRVDLGDGTTTVRKVRPVLAGSEIVLAVSDDAPTQHLTVTADHVLVAELHDTTDFVTRLWVGESSAPDWASAVAGFTSAAYEVTRLTEQRQTVAEAVANLARYRVELDEATREVAEADHECAELDKVTGQQAGPLAQAEARCGELDEQSRVHARRRPLLRGRQQWEQRAGQLDQELTAATEVRDALRRKAERHQARLGHARGERDECESDRVAAEQRLERAGLLIEEAHDAWPGVVPSDLDMTGGEQLCTPWADPEYTAARERLTAEALRLHEAFALNAASRLRANLTVAAHVIEHGLQVAPDVLLAAWQSLFLVVPAVSTTLAAMPALFDGLEREALGWLFVDSAGELTPQQVVGGLWRSRRAVLVGDPRQDEPAPALPGKTVDVLRRCYRVSEQWTARGLSAQRVADRTSRFGTLLTGSDTELWVGTPLRVRHRVEEPLVDLGNRIAYGGDLLVPDVVRLPELACASRWIDVSATESRGNWVPAEGEALDALLRELIEEHKVPAGDIAVTGLFAQVTDGARPIVRQWLGDGSPADGPVDVLVLVLGGDPNSFGGRVWAATTPNPLAVATARATRRLYVIGNWDNWHELPHFAVLADVLDRESPDSLSRR
ncbi:hypothetical protein [Pseudonocardia spinosispora]|uniref:hypothetical protein n=1 Tax=Pseudonocardia spinosispora TaxID=103441 RepID=UPI00041DEFAC|nr:hypothetical protein [Pseudonocardia spinosispora]